jgi:DNA-binding response OmpR family regulator
MKILLIDQCSKLLDANRVLLEMHGHNCFLTTSLTTAISMMDNFVFDLIILEYDFSGKRPFSLLSKSLENQKSIKIIILTNFLMTTSDINKLRMFEIQAIYEKPISPTILLETINKLKQKHARLIFSGN